MAKKNRTGNLITDMRPMRPVKRATKISHSLKKYKRVAYVVVLVAVIMTVVWALSSKDKVLGQEELALAKSNVGKLMILPGDEEPTLAVVEDRKKLADAYLADKTEEGDQLLIYAKNRLVIIYRPKVNKIVTAGDLFADPALAEAKDATVTVLNGSNDNEKTQTIISQLQTLYPEMKVTDGGKTNGQDFPNTIVIDNTDKKDYLVDAIVNGVKAKRGIVPLGEEKSTTDLEIIVGKD